MGKIIHIMRDDLRGEGVPSFPYAISKILGERGFDNLNIILDSMKDPVKNNLKMNYPLVPLRLLTTSADSIRVVSKLMSPVTPLLLIISKIKGIRTVSQPDFSENLIPKKKTFSGFLKNTLIRTNLSLFDRIVVATPYESEVLAKIKKGCENKTTIIPLPSKFKPLKKKPGNYILTVSCWKDKKNLHKIIKVFSMIAKKNKKIKLKIAGTFQEGGYFIEEEKRYETGREYEEKVKKMVKELDISKQVVFLGNVKGKELEQLFRKAKLFYLPSKFESFGMVYVEALSSGLPVVAEKNSAIKYIIKDSYNGFLKGTEEQQFGAIKKLLEDKKTYNKMSLNCLESSEKYQPEEIFRLWKKIL